MEKEIGSGGEHRGHRIGGVFVHCFKLFCLLEEISVDRKTAECTCYRRNYLDLSEKIIFKSSVAQVACIILWVICCATLLVTSDFGIRYICGIFAFSSVISFQVSFMLYKTARESFRKTDKQLMEIAESPEFESNDSV